MKIQTLIVWGVMIISSVGLATSDFNSLIENSNQETQAMQKSISRMVSSKKDTFKADTISVHRERAYNPVTYNPLIDDDSEVTVIVNRDPEEK